MRELSGLCAALDRFLQISIKSFAFSRSHADLDRRASWLLVTFRLGWWSSPVISSKCFDSLTD